VPHTTDHFEITTSTNVKAPEDGTAGVPKHVGGDFLHLLFICSSACKVGFLS
jgi:hypothetical protein